MGSLLNRQIPVRTWTERDGGDRTGGPAFTRTVTDIVTAWTENPLGAGPDRQMRAGRIQRDRPRDAVPDLLLLNEIWQLPKLMSKTRGGRASGHEATGIEISAWRCGCS